MWSRFREDTAGTAVERLELAAFESQPQKQSWSRIISMYAGGAPLGRELRRAVVTRRVELNVAAFASEGRRCEG